MPTVRIFDDVRVTTEINTQAPLVGRMGVAVSEPIRVGVRTTIAVTGVVLGVQGEGASCRLEVQSSNDLWTWQTLNFTPDPNPPNDPIPGDPLPKTRAPFSVAAIEVPGRYTRVRLVLRGNLAAGTSWRVSAVLNTGGAFARGTGS